VQGDVRPLAELLRLVGSGLVVTELIGQGVNGVTGDYSRGAAGFWVEDGVMVWPVDECTVAGNLRDMFRDIVAIGDDPDLRGNLNAPSMLIGSLTVAGG
jgi:PmbA protein